MNLTIFQSQKGDCLLLESGDGHFVLVGGGMKQSMEGIVRDELAKLRDEDKTLDRIYVSHIDQDHISGVLQLLKDELAWRVHDHHKKNGETVREPKAPRPPVIGGIWHNAFSTQLGENAGDITELLAAAAPALLATGVDSIATIGSELSDIALSVPEAIEVSQLASAKLLNIPLNEPASGHAGDLMMVRQGQVPIGIGSMKLTIVGPTEDELGQLREGWNNWLRENKERVRTLRAKVREKIEEFASQTDASPFDLRDWNGIEDYKHVTVPNIASLMFMVEEDGKRILLTGDSHHDMIINGLKATGYLDDGHLHLDVLKVQHHGSEHNIDQKFCRKVSADHYVFCGNGEHGNPELEVIQLIYDSRMGDPEVLALSPKAQDRDFTFWFSTTSDAQKEGSDEREAFEKVEKLAEKLKKASKGRLKITFNKSAAVTLSL